MFLVIYTHILLLFNKQRNKIEMLHNYNFIRFSLKALLTTLTELKAIAAPAIKGQVIPFLLNRDACNVVSKCPE